MIPAFRHYLPPALPFSWGKALRREFYGLFAITTGFFVLDVVEDYWVTGGLHFDPLWPFVFILSAFFFAVMRTWKKRMAG